MTDELFAKVLRDCTDMGVKDVNLQFLGEPLLDRKICQRIRAAKELGFRVQMVSNASLLDESMSSQLLASGLDELRISMDGFTEKTYEDIRIGLKFERVKRNILGFLDLSSRFSGSKPRVVMTFVRLPENKTKAGNSTTFGGKKLILSSSRALELGRTASSGAARGDLHNESSAPPLQLPLGGNDCALRWQGYCVLQFIRWSDFGGQRHPRQSVRGIWLGPEYQRLRNLHRRSGGDPTL